MEDKEVKWPRKEWTYVIRPFTGFSTIIELISTPWSKDEEMWSMSIGVVQVLSRRPCWWNFMCVLFDASTRQSHSKHTVSWIFGAFLFHSGVWATGVGIVLWMDASCVRFIIVVPGCDRLGSQDNRHTPQYNPFWSETHLGKHSGSATCYFNDTENMVLISLKFLFPSWKEKTCILIASTFEGILRLE